MLWVFQPYSQKLLTLTLESVLTALAAFSQTYLLCISIATPEWIGSQPC